MILRLFGKEEIVATGFLSELEQLGAMIGIIFFSSRCRHTIFDCDWSSDVCSSDLVRILRIRLVPHRDLRPAVAHGEHVHGLAVERLSLNMRVEPDPGLGRREIRTPGQRVDGIRQRSEERRVGKECRSRWSPYP